MQHFLRKTFLILISFTILATIISFTFSSANAEQSTSWLEEELEGNEVFISATEKALSKNRKDITLQDLESITSLYTEGASSVPNKITDFKNLTTLFITKGTLTEVPDNLAELKKVSTLNFYNNNLTEFPMVILKMPALESLSLGSNSIEEIPVELTSIASHFSSLDLRNNKLISIPTEFFTTDWASNHWPRNGLKPLIVDLGGNQITTDIPADYLDNYNNGGNMLEHYSYRQGQDQLVYNGEPITVPFNTDFKQLQPDESKLGLASNKALFTEHEFEYYDDGSSTLENGVATKEGPGFITIKSTLSIKSNPFAKVRVPIVVEAPPNAADIIVEYKSTAGETIAPTETLNGLLDANYTSSPKTITGYTLTETPANATGTFLKEPQTVTYLYSKDPVPAMPVTVNYVDDTGETLAPSETFSGFIDEDYTSTEKLIDGYTLTEKPANATGKLTASSQTVNYVYKKNIITAEPVTVNYLSDTDEILAEPTVLEGNVGDDFTSEPKTIVGYDLITTPNNAKGTFSDKPQTVDYIYSKKTANKKLSAGRIKIEYVDSKNIPISNPSTVTGEVGKEYKVAPKEIPGYKLEESKNVVGTFEPTPKNATFVYKKINSLAKTSKPTIKTTKLSGVSTPTLPKTGDDTAAQSVFAGILLLSSFVIIWRKSSK
ncbi:LPXTG cell wall anchor domain-containing protein [Listeria monocytogenes]|nr:LPXTG cell wall anchor domain-containing protein [Listeria monocytogenes]